MIPSAKTTWMSCHPADPEAVVETSTAAIFDGLRDRSAKVHFPSSLPFSLIVFVVFAAENFVVVVEAADIVPAKIYPIVALVVPESVPIDLGTLCFEQLVLWRHHVHWSDFWNGWQHLVPSRMDPPLSIVGVT